MYYLRIKDDQAFARKYLQNDLSFASSVFDLKGFGTVEDAENYISSIDFPSNNYQIVDEFLNTVKQIHYLHINIMLDELCLL